jgi:hypothetical protein
MLKFPTQYKVDMAAKRRKKAQKSDFMAFNFNGL